MLRFISLICVLLFTVLFYAYIVKAQTPSPYIYRVKASQCDHQPTSRQLTGFRLQGKHGIVTALHGVIDCNSITAVTEAENGLHFVDLEISEVDVERDVALLSSDELDQLSVYDGLSPVTSLHNIENQYFSIVGYPVGLLNQTSLTQALILGRKQLKYLIPYHYRKELRLRNSPNPSVSVLQIQTHLVPGHSGAPVFDSTNQVVGIGNGGLEKGTIEIGWLIPITDIEWQSLLAEQYQLDEVRSYDPQLALHFSSTYLGKSPFPTIVPIPTETPLPTSTFTSLPTSTSISTFTPSPTRTPLPKNTPLLPITNGNANIRTGPGVTYDWMSTVLTGTVLNIVGINPNGDWYLLDNGGWIAVFLIDNAPTGLAIVTPPARATPAPIATFTPIPSAPTPSRGIGSTYSNPIDGATYVYVPAGEFIMGSEDGGDDESPVHTVYLDSYWIMQTEVTNIQYQEFLDADGYTTESYWSSEGWSWRTENNTTEPDSNWKDINFSRPDQPIIEVSWYEAEAYANWLSDKSGLDFGLPTEAQWEKAARGTDGRHYPWGNQWDGNRVNYCDKNCTNDWADEKIDDGYQYTSPVGKYPAGASPYGAWDMVGNVWEWTADWYSSNYYETSPYYNATGPENGERRVVRGGSWYSFPETRTTKRLGNVSSVGNFAVGFRLRLSSLPD